MSLNSGILAREAVGHGHGRTWTLESTNLGLNLTLAFFFLHDFEQGPFLGSLICKVGI